MDSVESERTQRLAELLATPPERRDDSWSASFLSIVPNVPLVALDPRIEPGPDHFPYFQLALPDAQASGLTSLVQILEEALQNGVGAVIHSSVRREEKPVWVFTLGDLVSYSLFHDFSGDPNVYGNPDPPPDGDADRTLLRSVPSEAYFPASARAAMGRFMRGPFQHPDPRIGLVSGPSLRPRESLMVNLRASDYGGDMNKLDSAMRYLTWFVPNSYSVMALPEDWSDAEMAPLA